MKPRLFNYLVRTALICLGFMAVATSCAPEDDDFLVFTPVDFFITADGQLVEQGKSITFANQSQNSASQEWTFEGGSPATSTEMSPTVTYPEPGIFFANVTTTLQDGRKETRSLRIQVVPFVVAGFSANPTALQAGGDVQFINQTAGIGAIPDVFEPEDTNITFEWIFEGADIDRTNANKPKVTYNDVGSYDVTLRVTRLSTNSTDEITKEDFIKVFADPVTQARSAKFNRDGSAIILNLNEALGSVPADFTDNVTITNSSGAAVPITSTEISNWGDHVVILNVDNSGLTVGENCTLSFSNVGSINVASGAVLLPFSYTTSYLGGAQTWAELNFDTGNGNDPRTTTLGGKEFTFDQDGVTFIANANTSIFIFNQGAAALTQTYHTAASPYTMLITPGMDVALTDIGDVGLELGFLGVDGTVYTFSQPITDLRFVNGFGNPDFIPEGTLSADGMTFTLTKQGQRNQAVRVSAILEGTIKETGLVATHNAPQGGTIYVTASGR